MFFSASEAASDLSSLKKYFKSVLLLFVHLLLCFVHYFLALGSNSKRLLKSIFTSWFTYCCWHRLLDAMFHNKEREMTSDMVHWCVVGANMLCVDILMLLCLYYGQTIFFLVSRWKIPLSCPAVVFWSLFSAPTEKKWNIKHWKH